MNFAEMFIRRPVLASVVSLLIFLLGLEGAMQLGVREYPKIHDAVITIKTAYPGADGELIQGFITTPIAKAAASVEGVDYVTSGSQQGSSTVTLNMRLGADPDRALTDAMSKVQAVKRDLPQDAEDPIVQKGTGLTQPLILLTLASPKMTSQQIGEYVARVVQPYIATVDGVGEARILGATDYAMRVWLDPLKLAAHNVTAAEISTAIRNANYLAAPGSLKNDDYTFQVKTDTTLQTPEAFGALPIRGSGDAIVRLRDVARVELGARNYDVSVTENKGSTGSAVKQYVVGLGIFPNPTANPVEVGKGVRKAFATVLRGLPPELSGRVASDNTLQISAAIHDVFVTMGATMVVVVIVIFLFLGSMRSVIIPAITIPLSLVGVCFVLFSLGYSINLLTLLAMVLAIGLVVDDAIVVVENVHRHIERGEDPKHAAIVGMKEIFGPIVAMTLTLAAVYAPVGFVKGLTGGLFREFAFALAGAVIISGIIAVTLSPMLSSVLLKPRHAGTGHGEAFADKVDRVFAALSDRYRGLLKAALGARSLILVFCAFVLVTTWVMFQKTGKELAPVEDRGFLAVFLQGPEYATANYMSNASLRLDQLVGNVPEVGMNFTLIGAFGSPSGGLRGYVLKPWSERKRGAQALNQYLQTKINQLPDAMAYSQLNSGLPGVGDGLPISFVVRGVGSPEQVYEVGQRIKEKALESRKFFFMTGSFNFDAPRSSVIVDRQKAAALGVPIADVGATLSTLVGENWISRFDRDNRSYEVIPQVPLGDRLNPSALSRYYVRSAQGAMVPLSALTRIEIKAAPSSIQQFNQLNATTLQAIPGMGMTVNDGLKALDEIAREVMPDGFFTDVTGAGRLAAQEGSSLAITFIFAVIIIYLVLAAQFESFRDPLIILVAVPFSIFGALIPLNILGPLGQNGATLNIYSELGLITLVGLIAKHGILLVKFANDRRLEGVGLVDAIMEAAHVRLRPILMTTAAMVVGVFPLLIASGAGAGARFSIGLVIAAGMAIGTMFTLFVVPVFYTLIAHKDVPARAARVTRSGEEDKTRHAAARAAE